MTPHDTYENDGFYLAKGLFSSEEVARLRDHAMALHATGDYVEPGAFDPLSDDPLKRFPRLMQPHRGDETCRNYLLEPRIGETMREILGEEPVGVQTMIYYKPAGSRGQALHQDQRYLHVQPGTCVAAWLALDRCDEENGCLRVVPGSHRVGVLCPVKSDGSRSFTSETVEVPEGMSVVDVVMEPGDVLFFHGNLVHGSEPNRSADRFRRIIVGHYATADATQISRWYPDALRFDGSSATLDLVESGGKCGEWRNGEFRETSTISAALAAH